MTARRVIVVGAGMGGLAAAMDLACRGFGVRVLEQASAPGGKMREVLVDGAPIDGGPTVFTMRWIFEALFEDAGTRLDDHLDLHAVETLARHAWRQGGKLDLFADIDRSADAIGVFAGARDADGYRAFCARSRDIYLTLKDTFIADQKPSPVGLVSRVGLTGLAALVRTVPFSTMWKALGSYFSDPRLRQLFARYATYCGSSPFLGPATLMLVAHVEQDGVWQVRGGMRRIADAMRNIGEGHGASYRFDTPVREILVEKGRAVGVVTGDGERIEADAVVFNGDVSALATGLLGDGTTSACRPTARQDRSLSAVTWCVRAPTSGFPLTHHNVFFGDDYADEFDAIFRRHTITGTPTLYVCAQDRGLGETVGAGAPERLLMLINAPADGDRDGGAGEDIAELETRAFGIAAACGLEIDIGSGAMVATTPAGFGGLFPGTGGALYGRASHGSMATFRRPGALSRIPGLYLAGGSAHPGPGIPMATMSGRLAAAKVAENLRRDT